MNLDFVQLDQIISVFLIMNKHPLHLLMCFVLQLDQCKLLNNRFWLTLKSCYGSAKLFMTNLLSNSLHEKVNDMLVKVD